MYTSRTCIFHTYPTCVHMHNTYHTLHVCLYHNLLQHTLHSHCATEIIIHIFQVLLNSHLVKSSLCYKTVQNGQLTSSVRAFTYTLMHMFMWFFITYLSDVKNNKQKLHFKETVYSSWILAKR